MTTETVDGLRAEAEPRQVAASLRAEIAALEAEVAAKRLLLEQAEIEDLAVVDAKRRAEHDDDTLGRVSDMAKAEQEWPEDVLRARRVVQVVDGPRDSVS